MHNSTITYVLETHCMNKSYHIQMTHHLSHQTYKISFQIHILLRLLSLSIFFNLFFIFLWDLMDLVIIVSATGLKNIDFLKLKIWDRSTTVVVIFDDDRLKKKLPLLQCHVWRSDILLLPLSLDLSSCKRRKTQRERWRS